jgi:hypothetical protein
MFTACSELASMRPGDLQVEEAAASADKEEMACEYLSKAQTIRDLPHV